MPVKHERIEVSPGRPGDRPVVDDHLGENLRVLERLEDRTPEFVGQIDVALEPVVER